MSERLLGRIVRLQVQREPLKSKEILYDPSPLASVDRAAVGSGGMVGWVGGGWMLDAHHVAHPRARGGGNRALSIGFTGHYARMAERFGEVPVGVAGENIVIGHEERLFETDLQGALVIIGRDGDLEARVSGVAAPCREFTSYLLGLGAVAERSAIADELEYLEHGTRGFIVDVSTLSRPVSIEVGDRVLLRT